MRRIITTAALALAASSVAVGPTLASAPPDTSPGSEAPASTDAPAGSDAPAATDGSTGGTPLTDPVVVVDNSGSPVAAVAVTSVEQAWTGFGEYPLPDVGYEYLRVGVVVESRTPRGVYDVQYYHFLVQDVDGFVTSVQIIPTAEQAAAGEQLVTGTQLANGATFELELTFEMVAGVGPQALFYQPSSNRLITVYEFP